MINQWQQWLFIVENTVKREARSKVLIFFAVATVLIMIFTNMGFDFVSKMIKDAALSIDVVDKKMAVFCFIINFWSVFMGLFFGLGATRTDVENGVLPLLLTLPIPRWLYVLGRGAGAILIVYGYYLISFVLGLIFFSISSGGSGVHPKMFLFLMTIFMVLLAAVAIGTLLSQFFSRPLGLSVCFFLLPMIYGANAAFKNHTLQTLFQNVSAFKLFFIPLHLFLPRFSIWNEVTSLLIAHQTIEIPIVKEIVHYLFSVTFVFFCIVAIFRKRTF